jgi:hypothetical protein
MTHQTLGTQGSMIFETSIKLLEAISIFLGFYAILHTSSAPFIEAEDDPLAEDKLLVDFMRETRTFVVAAISVYAVKFLLDTVIRFMLEQHASSN